MPHRCWTLLLLLAVAAPLAATAQPMRDLPFPTEADVPQLSDASEVSMLTMLPGEDVYALFGHTAVRVRDPYLGIDRTYNYGTFDFNQPNFVLRFLRGQMDYRLTTAQFEHTLLEYQHQRRPIIEQTLNLSGDERQDLFRFLETNNLPQYTVYRYDFLFDNCSTRPLDALEWVFSDRLSLGDYSPPPGSFRDLLEPYIAADASLSFGIDLGLGRRVDRSPTPREAVFLPLELRNALDAATVDGEPLVVRTDTLFWVEGAGMPEPSRDVLTLFMTALLALVVALTIVRPESVALRIIDVSLLLIAGLAGLILALLWFATEHHVTRLNVDLLWAWPTHLVAVVFVVRDNVSSRIRIYWSLAAAAAGAAGLLGLIAVLSMPFAAIPLALMLAVRLATRARPEPVVLSS